MSTYYVRGTGFSTFHALALLVSPQHRVIKIYYDFHVMVKDTETWSDQVNTQGVSGTAGYQHRPAGAQVLNHEATQPGKCESGDSLPG